MLSLKHMQSSETNKIGFLEMFYVCLGIFLDLCLIPSEFLISELMLSMYIFI